MLPARKMKKAPKASSNVHNKKAYLDLSAHRPAVSSPLASLAASEHLVKPEASLAGPSLFMVPLAPASPLFLEARPVASLSAFSAFRSIPASGPVPGPVPASGMKLEHALQPFSPLRGISEALEASSNKGPLCSVSDL